MGYRKETVSAGRETNKYTDKQVDRKILRKLFRWRDKQRDILSSGLTNKRNGDARGATNRDIANQALKPV